MRVERSRKLKTAGLTLSGAMGLGAAGAIGLPVSAGLAGLLALLLLVLNATWTVPILIAASAVDRLALQTGGVQVRIDIAVAVLLAALVANRLLVRSLAPRAAMSLVSVPLILYLLVNVISTVLFAQEKLRGLKLDLEIVAAVLTFTVILALLSNRDAFDRAIRALWVATVAEALAGLVCLLAYLGHITTYGVQQGDFGLPMVYGTQYEANIFGSFLLGNFFILLGDYAGRSRSGIYTFGLLAVVGGIAASMTRTVWLSLLLGLIVFAACSMRIRGGAQSLLQVLVAVPIISLLGLVLGSATPFAGRLFDLVNLHSSSASGRLVIFNAAIADWRHHILLGSGTGSFNFGAIPGQPHPWLPSLFLLTLHDTGVAGLAVFALLLVAFFRVLLRSTQRGDEMAMLVAGSIAGFSALLFAFQTTTGFWFAYPWIVAGLGVAAARLPRDESA